MANKALAGTKVVEYAQFAAGPYCSKLLGDLGAEVIKVEPPEGDIARKRGPFPNDIPDEEKSGLFLHTNTNKKGITLNLKNTKGQELFKRLTQDADVVVEDSVPGTMQRWKLGYKHLSQTNPKLVMTSITPFGQTGPYRKYKANYLTIGHANGIGYLTPYQARNPQVREREPIRIGSYYYEFCSGLFGALGTMAALFSRRLTGKGQQVDISKQEAIMSLIRNYIAAYFDDKHSIHRADDFAFSAAPNLFPTKDGYIIIVTTEPAQWDGMMDLMNHPEWAKQEIFNEQNRRHHAFEYFELISEWTKNQPKDFLFRELQKRGAPAAPIANVAEVPTFEHLKERNFFVELDHPIAGKLSYASALAGFSRTPMALERPAPLLGQHNQEIYCGRLSLNPGDLAKLRGEGII